MTDKKQLPTYRVVIRQERNTFVARDDEGNRRSWGEIPTGPLTPVPRSGQEVAEYLFHRDEIASVKVTPEGTEVQLIDFHELARRGENNP